MTVSASARLARFRTAKGYTFKSLAARLRVHRSMVVQLCSGARTPSLKLAVEIARLTQGWVEGAITPFEWVDADADAKGNRAA